MPSLTAEVESHKVKTADYEDVRTIAQSESEIDVFPEYSIEEKLQELEVRVKEQDLEIHLLKCALADTLRRITDIEENNKRRDVNTPKDLKGRVQCKQISSNGSHPRTKSNGMQHEKKSIDKGSRSKSREENGNLSKDISKEKRISMQSSPKKQVTSVRQNKSPENERSNVKSQSTSSTGSNEAPKLILSKPRSPKKRSSIISTKRFSLDETKSARDDHVKFSIRGRSITFYPPSDYVDKAEEGSVPDQALQLEWIFGYRGKDCRDNLFQIASGEIAYPMASAVVLMDIKLKKQRHYLEHSGTVKCVAVHLNNQYIASGQVAGHAEKAKPHIRVWDSESLETLSMFGHGVFERSVTGVEFLSEEFSDYLLAIDEVNTVYMYDWEKGTLMIEAKGSKEPIFSVLRNPIYSSAFVTYGKSHLAFWSIEVLPTKKMALSKRMAIYDKIQKPKFALNVVFNNDGDVISGDSNGNIIMYKQGSNRPFLSAIKAHTGGVVALHFIKERKETLSCGKDGQISLWDEKLQKIKDLARIDEQYGLSRIFAPVDNYASILVGTSRNCIMQLNETMTEAKALMQGHSDEMWGLAVHPSKQLFATCSNEQLVCLWSSETQENLWNYYIEDNAKSAEFHPTDSYIVVGTANGKLYFLDYENQEEVLVLSVSKDNIDDIKISPDAQQVAVACRDSNIYVYSLPKGEMTFKKPKVLQGHSSRVLHIDWCINSEFLQSNSADYELLYWQAESGLQVLSPYALRDVEWATWTCPFGFPVMGVWPEGADGSDINACSRSQNKSLIATGDDFCEVKLFRYPSVKLKSDGNAGCAHGSHVTCVRFLSEDRGLITVGGKDSSVMQWKIVPFIKEETSD